MIARFHAVLACPIKSLFERFCIGFTRKRYDVAPKKNRVALEIMGTITPRVRKDKSIGYTAQIRLKQGGRVIYTEAQTFDRAPAAKIWLAKRERELAQPGALENASKEAPALTEVIGRYIEESRRGIGRTKAQVLRTIQAAPIGSMNGSKIDSPALIQYG